MAAPVTVAAASKTAAHGWQWDDYCMAVALLSRERSKDPRTQVGACIVNEHQQIVSIGYNGMPIGCPDSDLPWGKAKASKEEDKHNYVCHAEMNAIVNRTSAGFNLQGCTIYTTLSPCTECAKLIVQSGIKHVVYGRLLEKDAAKTLELMKRARVTYRKYETYYKTPVIIDLKSGKVSIHEPGGTDPHPADPSSDKPRQVDLKWRDYHMAMAFLFSFSCRDQGVSQGGACIVNEEERTVGTGSSGYPNGCNEKLWTSFQEDEQPPDPECHAEMNAIVNRMVPSLKNCTMYTTVFPCNKCAQLIVQSGIARIVYAKEIEEQHIRDTSQKLLDLANIDYKKYNTWTAEHQTARKVKIVIDLTKVTEKDATHMEYSNGK